MQQCGEDGMSKRFSLGVVAAAIGSVSFGIAYAGLVNLAERTRFIENRSSWFVALGVSATLFLRRLLPGAGNIYMDFLAFFFTGVPMIANQVMKKKRLDRRLAAAKQERGVTHDRFNGVAHPRQRR